MVEFKLTKEVNHYKVSFQAMASPCEILLVCQNETLVYQLAEKAVKLIDEFENKYSRYRENNICWQLNNSNGKKVAIDEQTYRLLIYAQELFELSEGMFDISSGILRKIWQFQEGARPPTPQQVNQILPHIGFQKIQFEQDFFLMPKGMEIDLGGIGKEFCVDLVTNALMERCQQTQASYLVNLGGDLRAVNLDPVHQGWQVGLESVEDDTACQSVVHLSNGAIATSGKTKRYFEYKGSQYAHILNPKSGYPVEGAPRSVTVFADNCTLAGSISSLAQLQGVNAEKFLKQNQVKYLCIW